MSEQRARRGKVASSVEELDVSNRKTENLDLDQARTCLIELSMDIGKRDFEVLSKIVIDEYKNPDSSTLRKFINDKGIDLEFVKDGDKFAVQAKQKKQSNTVGIKFLHEFVGSAFAIEDFDDGFYITTSSYTKNGKDRVEDELELINGEELVSIMINNEIGIDKNGDNFDIDVEFWENFNSNNAEINTSNIPQANRISVVEKCVLAVSEGYHYRPEILSYLTNNTNNISSKRQAEYYTKAALCLGFVYEEPGNHNGESMKRWGLTPKGKEYTKSINNDKDKKKNLLAESIKEQPLIKKILKTMSDSMTRDDIKNIINQDSNLSENTSDRRTTTVCNLLCELPEVEQVKDGVRHIYRKC